MRKLFLFFVAAALVAVPVAAQTPARGLTRSRPAIQRSGDSARFEAIRMRFHRELARERAAMARTRDRMRGELAAAGWRPRMRGERLRARMAGTRHRARRRTLMRRRDRIGRRAS